MIHSPSPTDFLQLGSVRRGNKTARLPQSAVPVIHCTTGSERMDLRGAVFRGKSTGLLLTRQDPGTPSAVCPRLEPLDGDPFTDFTFRTSMRACFKRDDH